MRQPRIAAAPDGRGVAVYFERSRDFASAQRLGLANLEAHGQERMRVYRMHGETPAYVTTVSRDSL